jgi:F-type H+-transporting ATPase subunit b
VADENRERDMAETRSQVEQLRERAAADIAAERDRALAEVRSQVAELALAAAGRVVGDTMNQPRERRLVEEFLGQMGDSRPGGAPGSSPQGRN